MLPRASALFLILVIGPAWAADSEVATRSGDIGRRLSPTAPEVLLGDRLFFETRFAQYFHANARASVNSPLPVGDPVVHDVPRLGSDALPGPFRGRSMSCRHCHLGDDFLRSVPLAQRTYADFSQRSAIPTRNDGLTHTVRNTPQMVDIGLHTEVPRLLHFDGEFASAEDLIVDTLLGRNMGWLLSERAIAAAHIANIIRNDDGIEPRYLRTRDGRGLPYKVVLLGLDPSIPYALRIPRRYRIDAASASDHDIVRAVAKLIHAYMDSIRFGTEDTNRTTSSPYDLFLKRNSLPSRPIHGESSIQYARRLARLLAEKTQFIWITRSDAQFKLHNQDYVFGERELAGMKLFLSESPGARAAEHVSGCIVCHTPPQFTDRRFHNTGVSQIEYDRLFGNGAFMALAVPNFSERNAQPDLYLPATWRHPQRHDRFRSVPVKTKPGHADLGVWNIFANSDFPAPQAALKTVLCSSSGIPTCSLEELLPRTLARFKTPALRDLGHSNPYFHSGGAATLEDVLEHYFRASDLSRAGKLRNGAPELKVMRLDTVDRQHVVAFLKALNEDYH